MAKTKRADNGLTKKIIAIGSSLVMVITGGIYAREFKNNAPINNETTTSASDTLNNANTDEETQFKPENILYKPYSIKTNTTALKENISDIKDLTGVSIDEKFIRCLHYELLDENTALTADDFKDMTAEEWSEWFYKNELNYYQTLHKGVAEYVQYRNAILDGEKESDLEEYASKLPSKITTSYTTIPTEAKGYATYELRLDTLIENTLKDIKARDLSKLEEYSDEYLEIMQSVKNDNSILEGERYSILEEGHAIHALYSDVLDLNHPKENNELKKSFESNLITTVYTSSLTRFGYTLDPKDGCKSEASKVYEKYVAADAANNQLPSSYAKAKKEDRIPGTTQKSNGNHYTSTHQEQSATTRRYTESSTVKVPDNQKETTTKKPGNKPTGTTSVVTETTTMIYEYDVAPGEETTYSDANAASNDKTK